MPARKEPFPLGGRRSVQAWRERMTKGGTAQFARHGLWMAASLCFLGPASAAENSRGGLAPEIVWRDLSELGVEGRGWSDTKDPYDRLPAKAEGIVRAPVWRFGTDSAGLRFRFVTDADVLRARWRLRRSERLAMPHMSAAGVSGLDLYVRDGGRWHWVGVGAPDRNDLNERVLVRGLEKDMREYLLYLPLYNGVASVEIGLPADASFEPAPDRYSQRKPVVFYGSSRLQGACASRPGMAYPSQIGRRLDWPVINLGFSGNAKTEPEVAALLAELDPAVYVLDSLPNLTVTETGERMEPFIRTLRSRHPATPIVLVELVDYADAKFVSARRDKANGSNAILRDLYERLTAAGDSQLHYVSAAQVLALGDDREHTVDGAHPTDLGFFRMAEAVTPLVKAAIQQASPFRNSTLIFDASN